MKPKNYRKSDKKIREKKRKRMRERRTNERMWGGGEKRTERKKESQQVGLSGSLVTDVPSEARPLSRLDKQREGSLD